MLKKFTFIVTGILFLYSPLFAIPPSSANNPTHYCPQLYTTINPLWRPNLMQTKQQKNNSDEFQSASYTDLHAVGRFGSCYYASGNVLWNNFDIKPRPRGGNWTRTFPFTCKSQDSHNCPFPAMNP